MMKRVCLLILTLIAMLTQGMAQNDTFAVYSQDGRPVSFQTAAVDSILFNQADTAAIDAARVLQAYDHLHEIGEQIVNLYSNVSLLWQYLHNVEEKGYSLDRQQQDLRLYTDSLGNRLGADIDSLGYRLGADIDSLGYRLDATADSLRQRLDSLTLRKLQADSLLGRQLPRIERIDSITAQLQNGLLECSRQLNVVDSICRAQQADITLLQQRIDEQQLTIDMLTASMSNTVNRNNEQQYLTDTETGQRYKLNITGGVLTAQPVTYQRMLAISNSFFSNGIQAGIWWANRGMAATTDSCTIDHYLKKATGATIDIMGMWDFEANYSTDFDFETKMPISKDYDVIIVQIQENARYRTELQASWEAMYDYLKRKCPNARIIQNIGWDQFPNRYEAIRKAAVSRQIPLVDSRTETMTGNLRPGDYVTDRQGVLHAIQIPEVAAHPSDVGMQLIANNMLRALGVAPVNTMHLINIEQREGGEVSTAYGQWPEHGLVSIMVCPADSMVLDSITVTTASGAKIETKTYANAFYDRTPRVYHVFTMPTEDVNITPYWRKPETTEEPEGPSAD